MRPLVVISFMFCGPVSVRGVKQYGAGTIEGNHMCNLSFMDICHLVS